MIKPIDMSAIPFVIIKCWRFSDVLKELMGWEQNFVIRVELFILSLDFQDISIFSKNVLQLYFNHRQSFVSLMSTNVLDIIKSAPWILNPYLANWYELEYHWH